MMVDNTRTRWALDGAGEGHEAMDSECIVIRFDWLIRGIFLLHREGAFSSEEYQHRGISTRHFFADGCCVIRDD